MSGITGYFWFIIGYLILVVAYGLYITKKYVKSDADFTTAGRRLPMWVVAGTLIATWYGGGGITGTANLVYSRGLGAGAIFEYSSIVAIALLYFMAGKIRDAKAVTIPEVFKEKYGSIASVTGSIAIILAYVAICSYQFKGAAYVINTVTGLPTETGMLLCAVVIIALSATGGLSSVAYTDSISALFICISMISAVPLLIANTGGSLSGYLAQIPADKLGLGGTKAFDTLGYGLALIFMTLGDQNMFLRFGAAKDRNAARKSVISFIIGCIVLSTLTIFLASCAIGHLDVKPDTALIMVAAKRLPFIVGGCVLAASIAFMITTGDSYLLSAATNLTNDILQPYFMKNATDRKKLITIRVLIVAMGVFSYILIKSYDTILGVMMYAYTIYGAAISPALVAAMLWKKVTPAGGTASVLTGVAVTLIWELGLKSSFNNLDSCWVAIPASIIVLVAVSLCTKPKEALTA